MWLGKSTFIRTGLSSSTSPALNCESPMPHVALSAPDVGGVTFLASGGGTVYLPKRRLLAWVYLGSEPFMRQAVLDTGAPACTLPRRVWNALDTRGEVE